MGVKIYGLFPRIKIDKHTFGDGFIVDQMRIVKRGSGSRFQVEMHYQDMVYSKYPDMAVWVQVDSFPTLLGAFRYVQGFIAEGA